MTRRRQQAEDELHPTWRDQDGQIMHRALGVAGSWKTYVHPKAREAVLRFYHDHDLAGHPGTDQTRHAVSQHYHWPGKARDVREYVRECEVCQVRKARRLDGEQQQHSRQPTHAFQTIALDLMGPYPRSPRGKRFILVMSDMFTRWTEAYPCSNARASTIIHLMTQESLPRWGYPQSALTDNGSQFIGSGYQHLADALFCIRHRVNAATGHTPAEMVQGSNLHLPGEWATHGTLHDVEGTEERDQRRTDMYEDARRRQTTYSQNITPKTTREPPLVRVGDQVYARVHPLSAAPRNYCAGLAPRCSGPYKIQRCVGRTAYLVRLGGRRIRKIHRNDLRLATTPGELMPEVPDHNETHNDMHDDEQPVADEPEPATGE
ncbi:uncharacterized protein LOC134536539 [Bacillus rossius redtenbacheri]|uniref:uncharacterized protein LOC134536539 n=1 Tax=Bacillus rossius redtenbacheri TaxID=93214 RepID=UPI002FDE3292